MLKIYNFLVTLCSSFFPLIRLMTNKLVALLNIECTKGKESLRKTNILKITLGKNKDSIEYTNIFPLFSLKSSENHRSSDDFNENKN